MTVRTARIGLWVNAVLLLAYLCVLANTIPPDAGWKMWMLYIVLGLSVSMGVLGQQLSNLFLAKRIYHEDRLTKTRNNKEQQEAHQSDMRRSMMGWLMSIICGIAGLLTLIVIVNSK